MCKFMWQFRNRSCVAGSFRSTNQNQSPKNQPFSVNGLNMNHSCMALVSASMAGIQCVTSQYVAPIWLQVTTANVECRYFAYKMSKNDQWFGAHCELKSIHWLKQTDFLFCGFTCLSYWFHLRVGCIGQEDVWSSYLKLNVRWSQDEPHHNRSNYFIYFFSHYSGLNVHSCQGVVCRLLCLIVCILLPKQWFSSWAVCAMRKSLPYLTL